MTDIFSREFSGIYMLPLVLIALLLVAWLMVRRRNVRARSLSDVLKVIAFERIDGLIVPNGDEGEIQIDYLLLTAQGILIVHVKDVIGRVFGSDKMQDWTVISDDRRFTFGNPQHALYDRIAAVRQIVRQVPVSGRILFLDGAEFTKGVPGMVSTLEELLGEFGEVDKTSAKVKVEAFRPHWEHLLQYADDSA
jgi:hypothetical protein